MTIFTVLQNHLYFVAILAAIFGLIFGSFFNVVIARYPKMLYRRWQQECREHLNIAETETFENINLFSPPSHCPHCKNRIKVHHNIPILSYLFLRGKCAYCQAGISFQYPLVEALTAFTAVICVFHFGVNFTALAAVIFSWILIVLSFIDFREQILPDNITLSLLWIGLLLNSLNFFTTPSSAILAAAIAYALLWTVATLFKILRKKEGMGHGDFKLFAAVCAWLGLECLINTLLVALISSLLLAFFLLIFKRISKEQPLPFGPFIALGAWVTLLWGPFLTW